MAQIYRYTEQTKIKRAVAQLKSNIEASKAKNADIDIPVPEGLQYLPYQKAGIAFGLNNSGVLIADEPGLGKTIQAIGIINADVSMRKILTIVPASLKINWRREMKRWLCRDCSIEIINDKSSFKADVVIINYEQLKEYDDIIKSIPWDMVIADECHVIRNKGTQRAQMVIGAEDGSTTPIEARRKVFLTGTPIINRAREVWSLISYLNPRAWSSYESFVEQFCKKGEDDYGDPDSGSSNLEELQHLLRASVMIRRLKADVLDQLPPKFRDIVEMVDDSSATAAIVAREQEVYNSNGERLRLAQRAAQMAYQLEQWEQYEKALQQFYEIKKYALAEISRARHETALHKVPLVIDYIHEVLEYTDKVVVFAHHQDVIVRIAKEFSEEAVIISGKQSMKKRQQAVDRFQLEPSVRVCVASIMAAGVGLTLTAAHHVLFAELDWVPANITQAEDRCHRIGQTMSVIVRHLVLNGSLDVKMAKKMIEKQKIYEEALNYEVSKT